jgi:hypothetical protein
LYGGPVSVHISIAKFPQCARLGIEPRPTRLMSGRANNLATPHLCIFRAVERLYCKWPIQCLAPSKTLTPHPLTALRVCTPPPPWGEDTLAEWKGVGGQYFGRRQTQLCTLYICKYFVFPTVDYRYFLQFHRTGAPHSVCILPPLRPMLSLQQSAPTVNVILIFW